MIRTGLQNWWHLVASPNGRTGRSGFWMGLASIYGLLLVVRMLLVLAQPAASGSSVAQQVLVLCRIASDVGATAAILMVAIKRYHDRDKAGWWLLILCLPGLGTLLFLLECGFIPGTAGRNRFDVERSRDDQIASVFGGAPIRVPQPGVRS